MTEILDGLGAARTLKYTHNAALTAGDEIVINGQVWVAVNDTLADVENVFVYRGKCRFPKEPAVAHAIGDVLYWDDTNNYATKTVGTNAKIGMCLDAAASADTETEAMLRENA